MRTLVTGGNGFVGRYLVAELRARGYEVFAVGRPHEGSVEAPPNVSDSGASGAAHDLDAPLDLSDSDSVRAVVDAARADIVFHLAAQAFVPAATAQPLATYDTNIMGTARLVDALRDLPAARRPKLLFVSSAEVYGRHEPGEMPLTERSEVRPPTPYAASKVAGEAIGRASASTYDLRVVVTRAFNHIGPGQSDRFVVARFAKRLAEIAAGGDPKLFVGNLEARRDFLDVRDVVRAYADLAERSRDGEVYNVCSGTPTKIAEVLRMLVTLARVGVEIREDAALMRAADTPLLYGDNAKLVAATGWKPTYSLAQSLRQIYEAARAAVAKA